MYCAPHIKSSNDGVESGCLDRKALLRLIESLKNKYGLSFHYTQSESRTSLWQKLRDAMSDVCGSGTDGQTEICWVKRAGDSTQDVFEEYYKPTKPNGKRSWLKTSDIKKVLKQYEKVFSDFIFLGAVPIDFNDYITEIIKIDLCDMARRGITRIGCVFNMDPHHEKGSHWVCMYLDCQKKYVGYFDSYGKCPPPKEILFLMTKLSNQSNSCTKYGKLQLKCNNVRHQYKDTECGMYCIYLIYMCLIGHNFDDICNTKIDDDKVNELRDYFFRPLH